MLQASAGLSNIRSHGQSGSAKNSILYTGWLFSVYTFSPTAPTDKELLVAFYTTPK